MIVATAYLPWQVLQALWHMLEYCYGRGSETRHVELLTNNHPTPYHDRRTSSVLYPRTMFMFIQ